ncbi:MAG: molybdopterin-dependent oxidoreductase, partial [Halobaculum sp.]
MASSEGLRGVARGPVAVAVGSAFAALAASFLVAGISQHWLVFAVAQTIFSFTPDTLVAFGITRLGDLSQPLLVVAATVLSVTLFAGSTLLVVGISAASGRAGAETVFAVGVVQTLLGFFLTISPLPSLAGGLAGAAVVGLASLDTTDEAVPRRRLLRSLGAAGATVGLGGLFAGRRLTQLNLGESEEASREIDDPLVATLLETAAERSLDVPVAEPLVSADFYQVDINTVDPQVDPASWSLSITGAVEEEVSFALPDLREFSTEHRFVSLRCVGDNLNGRKLDTALWTGVPASEPLDTAGVPDSGTCCVMLRAEDGYYMEFPLAALEDALLVFEMNGRRLPRGHGAPVRALIPGHWGEINVKWLSEIEILTEEQKGYW